MQDLLTFSFTSSTAGATSECVLLLHVIPVPPAHPWTSLQCPRQGSHEGTAAPSPSNPRGWVAEQWGKAGLQHKAAQLGVSLRKSSCLTKQQDSSASLPVSQQPSGYTKQKWEPFQFLTQGRKLKINNFPPAIQLQQKLGDFQSQSLKELLCGFQPLAQSGQTLLHLCPASLGLVLSCRGCQLGFTGPTAKPAIVPK